MKRISDKDFAQPESIDLDEWPAIICLGIVTEYLPEMLLDGKYRLRAGDYDDTIRIVGTDEEVATYSLAAFYADCIAFEHDLATLAVPPLSAITHTSVPWIFKPLDRQDVPQLYLDDFLEAFRGAIKTSDGIWYTPAPYYDLSVKDLPFTGHYSHLEVALHLYNAALRQLDPLSQFLNFYRVFENIYTKKRRREALIPVLSSPLDYKRPVFVWPIEGPGSRPFIPVMEVVSPDVAAVLRQDQLLGPGDRINVMEVRRAEALARLDELRRRGMRDDEIVDGLHKETRCGIAHGEKIKRHDLGDEFMELIHDVKLVRYLARLAIEQKLN